MKQRLSNVLRRDFNLIDRVRLVKKVKGHLKADIKSNQWRFQYKKQKTDPSTRDKVIRVYEKRKWKLFGVKNQTHKYSTTIKSELNKWAVFLRCYRLCIKYRNKSEEKRKSLISKTVYKTHHLSVLVANKTGTSYSYRFSTEK